MQKYTGVFICMKNTSEKEIEKKNETMNSNYNQEVPQTCCNSNAKTTMSIATEANEERKKNYISRRHNVGMCILEAIVVSRRQRQK